MIQIVSTGPGDPGLINRKTLETMEEAGRLVLRTEKKSSCRLASKESYFIFFYGQVLRYFRKL